MIARYSLPLIFVLSASMAWAEPQGSTVPTNPVDLTSRRVEPLPYTRADLVPGSRKVLDMIAVRGGPPPWTLPRANCEKRSMRFLRSLGFVDKGYPEFD